MTTTKEDIYNFFNEMMLLKDNRKAWEFDELNFSVLTDDEETELYIRLFDETWHSNHENIASYFQSTRNPLSSDILYKTALRDDIEEFDYKPLTRKCTWALADIGTEQSKQYLERLANCGDIVTEEFAKKRLDNWESELGRKGQRIRHRNNYDLFIRLENYKDHLVNVPKSGQQIIGNTFELSRHLISDSGKEIIGKSNEDYVVVYQAYKPSIAKFALENQQLGGQDFSYNRMSWIKPNFLWMMYRCGWAEKENQEKVLAIWITKNDFKEILKEATFTSYSAKYFLNEEEWEKELVLKKVRLQWDPDHDPYGNKLGRRAIQLGLKDEVLHKFGKNQIKYIMDITDFVKEQKYYLDNKKIDKLLIPIERVIDLDDELLERRIGVEK
jgi:Domain of unknown function (DUF4291)